ncbi:MAG: DinB family protein [Sphingobacteriia bacterium]|nr:MAG: DinB family protein [Sphingobacteriia bacterium]
MSARPSTTEFAPFYNGYIQLVNASSVSEALEKYADKILAFYTQIPAAAANYKYADNKWTLKEMLQHVLDTERIMSYRLLRIARNDQTPLAGFDENAYAAAANVDHRSWESMVEEFRLLRQTTHALCHSLHESDWTKMGTASGQPISARALGFILLGHLLHHKNIIVERYAAGPGMADYLSLG